MSRSRGAVIFAAASTLGCARPVDAPHLAQASPSATPSGAPTASASAPPSSSAAPAPAPILPDGCYSDVSDELAAAPKLAALAARCVAGMVPLLAEPARIDLATGERHELDFEVADPSKCLRAAAAGDRSVREIELRLVAPPGASFAADDLPGSFALVGRQGPVCPAARGTYRVTVRVTQGQGGVALQIWRAR